MKNVFLFLLTALLCLTGCSKKTNVMDLSGTWQFTLDTTRWEGSITLPGSMTSNGLGDDIAVNTPWTGDIVDRSWFNNEVYAPYRQAGNIKVPFWLQPVKYYKGKAWYRRTVDIPSKWDGRLLTLRLERCHWQSQVWVDGVFMGSQNALSAPHEFDLTGLAPGRHTLTVCVDNALHEIDPGVNSHSISDHTQGNWNGMVGALTLTAQPLVCLADVQVFPSVAQRSVTVRTLLLNRTGSSVQTCLSIKVDGQQKEVSSTLNAGSQWVETVITFPKEIRLWDEFHPNLYSVEALLITMTPDNIGSDFKQVNFGFRQWSTQGQQLMLNNHPVFLRGTLDCAAFPLTGFPPTDKDSWMRILKQCRAYGLNHVRYHSWCPPEAAFEAADELGMYLEVECSSWANQSTVIGEGGPLDEYIYQESERMVRNFGNHPSFCMLKYGNEPAGQHSAEYLKDFVSYWKAKDARRLYCTASGWPNLPESDYLSDQSPRIQRWGEGLNSIINAQAPRTDYDWSGYINNYSQPMVSHEIGQWCVYPNFREMQKYTGVMKARNFEIFQESLAKNGMEQLADSFLLTSGRLQTLCYKADIEAALRTPHMGGFQLLGLNDFPGQGTALVGLLDAFWEEKGYVDATEFTRFCSPVVPLARMPKLIFSGTDTLTATVEMANFGEEPLLAATPQWTLSTINGKVLKSGTLPATDISLGNGIQLGRVSVALASLGVEKATALKLEVNVEGHCNDWNLWVYPTENTSISSATTPTPLLTDQLNSEALQRLEQGGTVLLSLRKGSLPASSGGEVAVGFSSIFWNTAWTGGQAPHTLGLLVYPEHPALADFPSDFCSDYQWWDAMSHGTALRIDALNKELQPIVRIVDDWVTNRPLALLLEMQVGNGRLLLSGIDFHGDLTARPVARALLTSLQRYMQTDQFHPCTEVSPATLQTFLGTPCK